MKSINYKEALQSLEDTLTKVYEPYGLDTTDISRGQISKARDKIDLSLDDKQTLKEHFRDIVHSLDATGDQSKTSLFYGGGDLEGKMGDQVKHLQDDFRNITATDVGKFMSMEHGHSTLTSKDFYTSVFGTDLTNVQVRQSMLNFKNEQWTPASANYAKATQGDALFAVGENANMADIMYGVEYKNIEALEEVKEINGVNFDETYRARPDEIKLNQLKVDTHARKLIDKENFLSVDSETIKNTFTKDNPLTQELGDFQKALFEKTQIAKAENISYDEMFSKNMMEQDEIVSNFYDKADDVTKSTLNNIEEYKNIAKVGKYGIVGAVALSMLPEQAEASTIPTFHLNAHLAKDEFDTLSSTEQIGAEIGVGFNAINAIQAGEEFKAGANKSATTLLDTNAYKQGLEQATDAWRPSATKDVVKLGAMDSAKVAGKSFLKKLPLIGLGAGVVFGIGRAIDGDWKGAGMEVASGAFSLVPGWGTAASVGMDAALLEKDTALLSHGVEKLLDKESEEEPMQSEEGYVENINIDDFQEEYGISEDNHVTIQQEESFDHTAYATQLMDNMFQERGWDKGDNYDNSMDTGMALE
jgi:hypothetical protein